MEARFLIPCGTMIQHASGAIEKNIWYCVDFVCTYAMQDPSPKTRDQIAQLFHLYLDMMYENLDEEVDGEEKDSIGNILVEMSTLETRMFIDFVSELYNQIYRYVVPLLDGGRNLVYSVEHMEVIHNNLLINLEMDEIGDSCDLNNIPPFGLIHLNQDGQEFHPLESDTRFYFEEFSEVMEFFKNSANYHLPGQSLKKIELRRVGDYYNVTLRYNKDYWDAFKITGPIPSSPYLEYKVED